MAADRPIQGRSDRVCLGAFAGAHGLGGLVRVRPFTGRPDAVGDYGPVENEAGSRTFRLSVVHTGGKGRVIVRVDGVNDRAAADALKGVRFCVDRERLPATEDEDEFYHADLIGLAVYLVDGRAMGHVRAVLPLPPSPQLYSRPTRFLRWSCWIVPPLPSPDGRPCPATRADHAVPSCLPHAMMPAPP